MMHQMMMGDGGMMGTYENFSNGPCSGEAGSKAMPQRDDDDASFTTVMLRNIPNKYTRTLLVEKLHLAGFRGDIDYLYLPTDFQNRCNVGYCFCNFRTSEARARFQQNFDGVAAQICLPGFNSYKICQVTRAKWQGRDENVRRLKSGPELMAQLAAHPGWLPILLDEQGEEVPFEIDQNSISTPQPRGAAQQRNGGGMGKGGRRGGRKGKGYNSGMPGDALGIGSGAFDQEAFIPTAMAIAGRGGASSRGGGRRSGKGGRGRGPGRGYIGAADFPSMVSVMTEHGMQSLPYDPGAAAAFEGGPNAGYWLGAPYFGPDQLYGLPYADPYGAAGYPFGWAAGAYDPYGAASPMSWGRGDGASSREQEALLHSLMEDSARQGDTTEEEPSDL